MNIDETLDHYWKNYPRNTRRWINKILARMYHNPMFPERSNEQEKRKKEEERHTLRERRRLNE